MKLLDVNVIVAAHRVDHPHASIARPFLDALVERGDPYGVTDLVAGSFLRIVTNRRVFTIPSSAPDAFAFLTAVRAQPGHVQLAPGPRHLALLEDLVGGADAVGDLVPDAQLAAIAVEHAAEIVSFDRDFARFDVRWMRPE